MLLKFSSFTNPAMVWLARNAPDASAPMVVRSYSSDRVWWAMRNPPLSMTRAAVDSVWTTNSRSVSSSRRTSSSISWGKVAMLCGLGNALVDEFLEQHPRDHVQAFEHALRFVSRGLKRRHMHLTVVEQIVEILDRRGVGEVALV